MTVLEKKDLIEKVIKYFGAEHAETILTKYPINGTGGLVELMKELDDCADN